MKKIFIIFSVALLIYMLWPGPGKIHLFNRLPDSAKSTLSGDTVQVPQVSAYFSNNFRDFVIPFYLKNYQGLSFFPFPPIRLNHPPEYSWVVIKKHTDSTYLEELVYPLRSSLYVNGFEPFYSDGQPKYWGSSKFEVEGNDFYTKTTLRFYPSALGVRFIVWAGIVLSTFLIYRMFRKIII